MYLSYLVITVLVYMECESMEFNNTNDSVIIDLNDVVGNSDLVAKISSLLDTEEYTNKKLFLKIGNVSLKQSQLLSIKALIEAMNSKLAGIKSTSEMTEASAISIGLSTKEPVQNTLPTFQDAFKTIHEEKNNNKNVETSEISTFAQLKKTNSIGDFVTDTNSIPEAEEIKEDENLAKETEEFLKEIQSETSENKIKEEDNEEILTESADIKSIAPETISDSEEYNIYEKLSEEQKISAPKDINSALDITFGDSFATNNAEINGTDYIQEKTESIKDESSAKYIPLDTEGITPEGIELIKSNTSDLPTLYLTQTLRSGQTVSYEGNIFIIGDVHPGSEVNATGDVTVWGILGGIVHAGTEGNTDAKVRALKLNPIQLRIANLYSRRNDTINVPYVQKTNEFTPEEARIDKNQIVIYKTLRRED